MLYAKTAAPAELTILDNTVFVKTDAYEVQFENGVITQLHNKLTAETYTLPLGVDSVPTGFRGRSGLLKRDGRSIWTDQATLTEARKVAPLRARLVFKQGQNEIRLFIGVDENTGDLLIEGLNAEQGNVLMHKELAGAMPGIVFSSEHLHEVTFFRESFAQRWKLPTTI